MSKKFKALALMLAVVIAITSMPISNVKAASSTQQKKINVNTNVTGKMTDSIDKIYYEFTVPTDGAFSVNVKRKDITDDQEYTLKLVDASGSIEYFSQGGDGNITIPYFGAKAGQKFYAVVERGWHAADKQFILRVSHATSAAWENEPNDNQQTAKLMSVNKTYYGTIFEKDNGDFFAVKAPSNGYFVFNLTHNDITQTGEYDLTVIDSAAAEVTSFHGQNGSSIKVGVKAGTLVYVKVDNNWGAKKQVYKLTPYFTASESFEAEPNNTANVAKPIGFGQVYTGIVGNWSNDDADFYSFNVSAISQVSIFFGPVDIANKGDWKVEILNSKGKSANLMVTDSGKTAKVKLAKGKYYIKISNSWGAKQKEYQLKVTSQNMKFKSKKPVIKSASIKKYSGWSSNKRFVGCSLAKTVAGADGYEVSVASTKKMRKPFVKEKLTGGKKLKTDKYFRSSSKYFYVQVRPYIQDPFGTYIYGKKSAAKKVATKAK